MKVNILIVEDEAIVAADIAGQLSRLGYEISGQTARGDEAVALARDLRPDLVLMDIRLAGPMDGVEAAEAIRRECGVPVIYLTAHSDTATLERAKLTEPFGYILKPFEERELKTHIEMALYRHRMERTLRESEQRFRMLVEQAVNGIFVADAAGHYTDVNTAGCQMLGYSREEILSRSIADLVVESEIPRIAPEVARFAGGQVLTSEWRFRRKDGSFFIGELVGRQLPDGRLQGILRDITERKRAENALRENEARLARTQEIAHLGSWELDLTVNDLVWSDEVYRIFGLHPREFGATYEAFLDHVHPEDRAAVDAAYCGSLREDRDSYEIDHRIVRKATCEVRWVHERCQHHRDAAGRIVRSVGMVHDITARKRAEQALQEARAQLENHAENLEQTVAGRTAELRVRTAERERLQQELLKISEREKLLISQELHDGLCQNLAGTAMMVSLLARGLAARGDKDAESAKQICALLNTSVHEARNLSHGLHPVGPEGEGLMNALANLAGTVSNLFHIRCTFRCPKPVILENGTASTHLFRVAQEAINNARKHGEADEVRISLSNTAKGITLTIRDNGVGIPSDLPKKRGMGLKSMGYRAAEIGATLTVRRGSRKGTVVAFFLPACKNAR